MSVQYENTAFVLLKIYLKIAKIYSAHAVLVEL